MKYHAKVWLELYYAFLQEREELENFRKKARLARATKGAVDETQSGFALPLRVSQRVIARHPRNRQLLEGTILTASRDAYQYAYFNI